MLTKISVVLDTHSSISSILNPLSPLRKLALEQNGPLPHSPSSQIFGHRKLRVSYDRNRFHSDKICDITYANIQGKECLIEKFRNSCVMDEDPTYRPKIFHSSGSLMGQEQESPILLYPYIFCYPLFL